MSNGWLASVLGVPAYEYWECLHIGSNSGWDASCQPHQHLLHSRAMYCGRVICTQALLLVCLCAFSVTCAGADLRNQTDVCEDAAFLQTAHLKDLKGSLALDFVGFSRAVTGEPVRRGSYGGTVRCISIVVTEHQLCCCIRRIKTSGGLAASRGRFARGR